jgi:uncharacterized protein YjbJ (UPF0337 family)
VGELEAWPETRDEEERDQGWENPKETTMNRDVFAGWWKQARGQAKSWWGQLTDDELDRIEGESEKLVGLLQTRYGWSREQAEQEVERRMGRAA